MGPSMLGELVDSGEEPNKLESLPAMSGRQLIDPQTTCRIPCPNTTIPSWWHRRSSSLEASQGPMRKGDRQWSPALGLWLACGALMRVCDNETWNCGEMCASKGLTSVIETLMESVPMG